MPATKTMTDQMGYVIPVCHISTVDKRRDRLVRALHRKAAKIHKQLAAFREECLVQISDFLAWEAGLDGVAIDRTEQDSVTLTTYDGSIQIRRESRDLIRLDERFASARQLIREYTSDKVAQLDDPEFARVVEDILEGRNGRVAVSRVLGLFRYKIQDPRWQQAMELIRDSIRVQASKTYARFYERPSRQAEYEQLRLDIAGA